MAQYQNPYEGIGNSLMNIGAMYYSQSEKRKEEERLRKEKEDERKYLAEQADKEWQRKAPLNLLKEKLVEAQTAAAEAQKLKTTVQTFTPKTQLLGNIARTTMPNIGPNGEVSYESTDETVSPLNQYPQRTYAPKLVTLGAGDYGPAGTYSIAADGTKTYVGAAPTTARKESGVSQSALMGQEIKIAGEQAKLDAMSDYDIRKSHTTREALQKAIDAKKATLSRYAAPAAPAAQTGPLPQGVLGALRDGWNAAGLGRSEESAVGAAFEGRVPTQVAADSASSIAGEPVKVNGVEGTPNATGAKPKAQENKTASKKVPPFSDMVAAFVKQKSRKPNAKEEAALRKKYEAWLAANKE